MQEALKKLGFLLFLPTDATYHFFLLIIVFNLTIINLIFKIYILFHTIHHTKNYQI